MFNYFVTDVSKRITNRYILISHNGDLSAPDGQDDAPRIGISIVSLGSTILTLLLRFT